MKSNIRRNFILVVAALLATATLLTFRTRAENDDVTTYRAQLSGFGEVPPKLTDGAGTFSATLSADGSSIAWTLSYTGLTGPPLFAHIHFGQPQNTGSVMVFFCGGGGRPACPDGPDHSGSVSGTWTAADILGVPAQNITAGDLAGFLKILGVHLGYANVHTPLFPAGEIRGQVRVHEHEHEHE